MAALAVLPTSPSLADAVGAWLRAGRLRGLSPVTLRGYREVLDAVIGFATFRGADALVALEPDLVGDWLDSRGRSRSVRKERP